VNFPAIVKKDGRRIEYERGKLLASFNLALRKRPVSTEQIDSAIERIEEKLLNLGQREVPSSRIGELVMRELKKLDKVAYIRFASVYRSFEDIDEFRALVDEVPQWRCRENPPPLAACAAVRPVGRFLSVHPHRQSGAGAPCGRSAAHRPGHAHPGGHHARHTRALALAPLA
jgi:transcriptional regulator NrdR family protein